MFSSTALAISVVVANVCGAGMILPQVVRLHRKGDPTGVSTGWTGVGIGLNAWWLLYAFVEQLWGLVPVSAGALLLYIVMAAQLHALALRDSSVGLGQHQSGIIRSPLGGVVAGLLPPLVGPAVALAMGGWQAVALTLGLAYSVQFLPALRAVLASADRRGVSATTWLMAFIEAAVWSLYGLTLEDLALTIGGFGGMLSAGLILVLLASSQSASPRIEAVVRSESRQPARTHE